MRRTEQQHHAIQKTRGMRVFWWFLMAWIGASAIGILLQNSVSHDTTWGIGHIPGLEDILDSFDRMFRMMGGVVVGMAWSARVAIKSCIYAFSPSHMSSSEHIWFPAALYTCQGIIRVWVYKAHMFFAVDTAVGHIMSDHVLLSSSIVAGLVCEIYLIYTSKSIRDRQTIGARLLYILAGILSIVLSLLIIHVYKTARYHHSPLETVASVLLGSILFKLTVYLTIHHHYTHVV